MSIVFQFALVAAFQRAPLGDALATRCTWRLEPESTCQPPGVVPSGQPAPPNWVVPHKTASVGDGPSSPNSAHAHSIAPDTLAGRAPALATEAEFHYCLALRCNDRTTALALLRRALRVRAVTDPAQKIQEALRQVAWPSSARPVTPRCGFGLVTRVTCPKTHRRAAGLAPASNPATASWRGRKPSVHSPARRAVPRNGRGIALTRSSICPAVCSPSPGEARRAMSSSRNLSGPLAPLIDPIAPRTAIPLPKLLAFLDVPSAVLDAQPIATPSADGPAPSTEQLPPPARSRGRVIARNGRVGR